MTPERRRLIAAIRRLSLQNPKRSRGNYPCALCACAIQPNGLYRRAGILTVHDYCFLAVSNDLAEQDRKKQSSRANGPADTPMPNRPSPPPAG